MILPFLVKLGIPQWLAELICGALIVGLLAGGGYWKGHHDASQDAELAQAQAQHDHDLRVADLQNKGEQLQEKFEELQRRKDQVVYQTLIKEVPRVTTVYRPAPGAAEQPLPRCVFTAGFVRVWNSALDPGLPGVADGAGQAPAAPDPAADELDSGVDQAAILGNHDANAQQCGAIADQLNAVLDFEEAKQKANAQ